MSLTNKNIISGDSIREINAFGIRINPLYRADFLSLMESGINDGKQIAQFGVNSSTINDIVRNEEFRNVINKADLVHIDGMSVVWALRSFGYDIPERVATPDLADDVLALANREKMSVFLFGAKEPILSLCCANISTRYPDLIICGSRNGYYQPEEEQSIFSMINSC